MRQYPYTPKNARTDTTFFKKWGILAKDLAQEEGTSSAAIHMRVMNYGTPFQRKKAPTMCEVMTGRTAIELGLELNVTPCTIFERLKNYGDAYYEPDWPTATAVRGTTRAEAHWSETHQAGVYKGSKQGWLHPSHPEYKTWRYKYIQQYCPTATDTTVKEADNERENTTGI